MKADARGRENVRRANDVIEGLSLGVNGQKMQLSQSVAMSLREQIISGRLKKGDFLRIDSLSSQLGVSSTPVREGLLLLQSESFVKLIPRRGFVVTGFSREDVLDMFWVQATIGAELAARASERMSQSDLQELREIQAAHEKAIAEKDIERSTQLGHEFHRKINLSAQAPRLTNILGMLTKQLPNRFYASIEGRLRESEDYHPMIISALRMKDPDTARSLMYRHIYSAAEYLIDMIDRQESKDFVEDGVEDK